MKISAKMRNMGLVYAYICHAIQSNKLFLIWVMRVSLFISFLLMISFQFIFAVPVHGQSMNSYEVSMQLKNESLLSGIKKIEAQTTLRFYYRKADISEVRNISLAKNTRTIEQTLTELLKNTDFSFRQIDNNILVEKRQQQTRYTITGKIIGPDQRPVEFATVRITNTGDQKIISTTLADTAGKFNLTVYEKGDYLLNISSMKADSLTERITVRDQTTIQLADLVLYASVKQLKNVTVTAKRPLITQEADRIVYDLQADPQSKLNSVLDMMRKVPYLSLDGQENILLKGSSGYRIFINGKPSAMVEKNPKDVLRSIPASTIKSIEVITTPPSKYDAEGLAGIINIITNKEIGNGYHGALNVSEKGPVGGLGAGGSFTFKEGDFGLSAIAGISRNNVPQTVGETNRTTTGTSPTTLQQQNTDADRGNTAYAGLELSYELDSLQLISGQLNWSNNESTGLTTQRSVLSGADIQRYRLSNNKGSEAAGLDAALNYQLGFKANKDQLLTLSYRYMKSNNSLFNHIDLFDQFNDDHPDYRQLNEESLEEQTIQADYVQPLKNLTIETGLKGIFRTNKSDFQYHNQNPLTGAFEKDQANSNLFNNSQDVLAVYNSYNYKTAAWQFKAGVRAEQTIIKGLYSGSSAQLQQRYLNVVPAVVANRKFDARSSLSVSFSKRIQRPAIAQLNPFVDRSNPNFERSGNPDLRPITSNALQISYLKSSKSTFNVALGYLYFNRVINAFSSYDPATNVTFTRYENYGKGRVFKINIYLRYPIYDNWDVVFNSDLRHVTFYGVVDNITVKNTGVDLYIFGSSGYRFEKGWRANLDITYRKGGILLPLGRTNGFTASTFSVNKDIVANKLTLSAAVSNPFTKFRYINEEVFGPNFLQTSSNQSYHRRFTVSLNYRFGRLKDEIKRNKRGIKNDDLSN